MYIYCVFFVHIVYIKYHVLLVCIIGLHNDTSPLDKKYKYIVNVIEYFRMTINHVSCEFI